MHNYSGGGSLLLLGFLFLLLVMFGWWRDVVREATFEGQHTKAVQTGLRWGVILFIVSEIMFFFAFFWAFFHSSLAPVPEIGGVWPPKAIESNVSLANYFLLILLFLLNLWCNCNLGMGALCYSHKSKKTYHSKITNYYRISFTIHCSSRFRVYGRAI